MKWDDQCNGAMISRKKKMGTLLYRITNEPVRSVLEDLQLTYADPRVQG